MAITLGANQIANIIKGAQLEFFKDRADVNQTQGSQIAQAAGQKLSQDRTFQGLGGSA